MHTLGSGIRVERGRPLETVQVQGVYCWLAKGCLERVGCDFWSHSQPLYFGERLDVRGVATDARTVARITEPTKRSVGLIGNSLLIDMHLARAHHVRQLHGLSDIAEQSNR